MSDSLPKCRFIPLKGGVPCSSVDILPYGFCTRHKNTIQARKAHELWKSENEIKKEAAVPELPAVQVPVVPAVQVPAVVKVEQPKVEPTKQPVKTVSEITKTVEKRLASRPPITVSDSSDEQVVKERKPGQKLVLSKNSYGRFEEPVNHFVFNKDTKEVYGVQCQDSNGSVRPLRPSEKRICVNNGWRYKEEADSDDEKHKGSSRNAPSSRISSANIDKKIKDWETVGSPMLSNKPMNSRPNLSAGDTPRSLMNNSRPINTPRSLMNNERPVNTPRSLMNNSRPVTAPRSLMHNRSTVNTSRTNTPFNRYTPSNIKRSDSEDSDSEQSPMINHKKMYQSPTSRTLIAPPKSILKHPKRKDSSDASETL